MVYETIFFTSGLKITCTRAVVHSLQFNNIDAHLFFNIALSQGLSIGFKSTMKSHFYCSLILCEVLLFFLLHSNFCFVRTQMGSASARIQCPFSVVVILVLSYIVVI